MTDRKIYPTDISDQQWAILEPLLPTCAIKNNTKSYCKNHLLEIQQNLVETLHATSLRMQCLYKSEYMNRI